MFIKFSKINISLMLVILVAGFLWPLIDMQAQDASGGDIQELSQEIQAKQSVIDDLKKKITAYEKSLETERAKSSSLKNQIYILETQIQKKESEIKLNQREIEQIDLETEKTQGEIEVALIEVADKQNKLSNFLRELYRNDQKSELEVLIMYDSISDFFNQLKFTENIQNEVKNNLSKLKDLNISLAEYKKSLEEKKEKTLELQNELAGKQANLEDQQYSKQYLLDKTKSSEARYQNLVQELKLEQSKINSEIVTLEKAIRARLSGQDASRLSELGEVIFSWPVPNHTVTALFHDPDYPFRHIFEHPAIDIRAGQGTPLRAAASGYVAQVRDGGRYGYSYIMLIHNNGFSTVYGHVNQIHVKIDQFVTQGEVIGATGGMPGTNGAGQLTTGPHLHFEVRKNGIPVNPLDYLP